MNRELIGHLIGLRYKLMWAKTRSRGGRIALFVIGYLLFVLVAALLAAGGIGGGIAAVKSGQAGMVARISLSGIFLSAVMWTLLLGFGMNAVFSESELRRYPLSAGDRRLVTFFIGIADPFWFLILLCDLGLSVGIYVFGSASIGLGLPAVLLLVASNYALARTLGMLIDRLAETKMGSSLMLLLIMSVSMLPSILIPLLRHNPALTDRILAVLRFTPPFAAADAITASGTQAYCGIVAGGGLVRGIHVGAGLGGKESLPRPRGTNQGRGLGQPLRADWSALRRRQCRDGGLLAAFLFA